MMYFTKLTGEDLSHYLNKLESIGLRKRYASARSIKCLHFLALHHGGQNSWHK